MSYFVKTYEQYQNSLTDWLCEHKIEDFALYANAWNGKCYWLVEFKSEEDALAFKLRWG